MSERPPERMRKDISKVVSDGEINHREMPTCSLLRLYLSVYFDNCGIMRFLSFAKITIRAQNGVYGVMTR